MWLTLVLAMAAVAAAGVGLAHVPSGSLALIPHDPIDVGGRIVIDGKRPEPVHGKLFLVGVEARPVSVLQKLYLGFDESVSFEPEQSQAVRSAQRRRDQKAIASSKEIAAAVALELLGHRVRYSGGGAIVTGTAPGTPGARLLRRGDRIVRLNGEQVITSIDVTRAVSQMAPGTKLTLGVRRDGRPARIQLRTVAPASGDDHTRSRIGIALTTPSLKIVTSRKVEFETKEVVGPSAGLTFAIATYDSLSPVDVLRGRHVVATGALTLDGAVAPVGSVREKAIAAQNARRDIIVVPQPNVDQAVEGVQLACDQGQPCTKVLGVGSVLAAIKLLQLDEAELETHFAN